MIRLIKNSLLVFLTTACLALTSCADSPKETLAPASNPLNPQAVKIKNRTALELSNCKSKKLLKSKNYWFGSAFVFNEQKRRATFKRDSHKRFIYFASEDQGRLACKDGSLFAHYTNADDVQPLIIETFKLSTVDKPTRDCIKRKIPLLEKKEIIQNKHRKLRQKKLKVRKALCSSVWKIMSWRARSKIPFTVRIDLRKTERTNKAILVSGDMLDCFQACKARQMETSIFYCRQIKRLLSAVKTIDKGRRLSSKTLNAFPEKICREKFKRIS